MPLSSCVLTAIEPQSHCNAFQVTKRSIDLRRADSLTFCVQLTGPKAHQTILTMPTDERWKAMRKAVATAFSNCNLRTDFPGQTLLAVRF